MGCDLGDNHILLGRRWDYIDELPRLRASSWRGWTGSPGSLSLVRKPSVELERQNSLFLL